MTFLHKLARRLARIRRVLAVAVAATIACELPVADPLGAAARLLLSPKASTLRAGQVTQFYAVGLGASGDTVAYTARWKATGGSIVDTGTNGGRHYVSYRSPDQAGRYQVISQSATSSLVDSAVVDVVAVPVAAVVVSPSSASFTPGQTLQFGASPQDSSGASLTGRVVTWGSGNTAVATVNGTGVVTGVANGSATITATSEGRSGTAAVTVTQTAAPVASVSVTPASPSVAIGQTVQLVATPRDAGGTALAGRVVTWTSSNPAVALVGGSGLVTGVAAGSTTITATSEGKSGAATVTVTQPVASVTVAPASASVTAGQTVQLTATPRDASGNALTGRLVMWGSNNPSVATVSGTGMVTAVTGGTALITATSEGKSGSSTVTVPPPPVASVSVSPSAPSVPAGQTIQLAATLRDAGGNVLTGRVVTWASGNTAAATVSGSGLVSTVAAGSAAITATSEGRTGTSAVTVTAPAPPGSAWPNEPPGFVKVTETAFNSCPAYTSGVNSDGWSCAGDATQTIVADPAAPVSPSNVFQEAYPQGFVAGSSPGWFSNGFGPNPGGWSDHYVGYYFMYSNPYSNQAVGTKQWYPYNPTADYFVLFNNASEIQIDIQSPAATGGTYNLYANVNNPKITLGVWHRFELYFKRSSSPSTADGIIRWWIDGALCGNYTNIQWPNSGFDEARFDPTWGGVGGSVAFDSWWRLDHVRVSRP